MSSQILRPFSWYDMLRPSEQELIGMLRLLYGPSWFRIPRRKWEELWIFRRGSLNASLDLRRFRGPKYQRGIIVGTAAYQGGTALTDVLLSDIAHLVAHVAPTAARQSYAYDSDGGMRHDLDATTFGSIVYSDLTTQTDDTNDHTSEWWKLQPDTNEGLNWDIRYLNEATVGTIVTHLLADNTRTNRVSGTWYLLDTVSNDHADATDAGAVGCNRTNGTSKNPDVGLGTLTVDVEIRATGVGSAVANHSYDLDCEGT